MKENFFDDVNPDGGMVEAEVWRAVNRTQSGMNQWGEYDYSGPQAPIPALAGRKMVASDWAVMEPRTTRIDNKAGQTDGVSVTAITLFFKDFDLDIRPGDMIAFVDHKGSYEAWKLEGEAATNLYVSPFSGVVGGREVFLIRNREMR